MSHAPSNLRPAPDAILVQVAEYALRYQPQTGLALQTARLALMDALGCAFEALQYPACTRLLGPIVPNAEMPTGARVPGTAYRLDPVRAAFNLGAMIRWLDYNDTWLAAEWGHPSDNLGGILMLADWLSRSGKALTVRDVLEAQIVAYEVQGALALENAFNRAGLDHVLLVKVGTTAAAARLLGLDREQTINALSNAWVDGQALRTYRHAPNTGSRKSWAAGDASARGVWLALLAQRGEMGYPSALTAPVWGFEDASFRSLPVRLGRELGSYVMENILFKVRFPAEFHAQTAVEAAIQLHPQTALRLEEIERVVISTQESALRIIDKTGPLYNPADRDHCIQYMTAIGLIFGTLGAAHYEDATAADPRIDALREKMICVENPQYTRDYLDPEKRSIGNAVQVFFRDGTSTDTVAVEYPIGHRRRRAEAAPLLYEKFFAAARSRFGDGLADKLLGLFRDDTQFEAMPVQELVNLMVIEG